MKEDGLAIFNLRCSFSYASGLSPPTNLMAHYTHLLKHSRSNILILTLSVPMQSNRTCFCFFSGCSDAYNLSRYPWWNTLNSQAAEQANSCLKSLKRSLSYMNEKNFMTHCKVFIGIEIRYGVSSSSPKV